MNTNETFDSEPFQSKNISQIFETAYKWLLKHKDGYGFKPTTSLKKHLLSSCYGVLILNIIDKLSTLSNHDKTEIGLYINSFQDKDTGLYVDTKQDSSLMHKENVNNNCIQFKSTYISLFVLKVLDINPKYPLNFLEESISEYINSESLEQAFSNNNVYKIEEFIYLLFFIIFKAETEKSNKYKNDYHYILDTIERYQNKETGLWGYGKSDISLSIIITYFIYQYYDYVSRPVMKISKIIDSNMYIYKKNEKLNNNFGNNILVNAASVLLLSKITNKVTYCSEEIRSNLMDNYNYLIDIQNPNGGFSYSENEYSKTNILCNYELESINKEESNIYATLFALETLSAIYNNYKANYYPSDITKIQSRNSWIFGLERFNRKSDTPISDFWLRNDFNIDTSNENANSKVDISVIIPCYNLGIYIYEALKSVFNQTFQDFEIIVVNDGSDDEYTNYYLESITQDRIRILNQSNQGLATARNKGVEISSGRYICCLDPDDKILPTFFEKAYNILEKDSNIGFVSSYFETFDEMEHIYEYKECSFPDMLVYNQAIEPTIFRKTCLEKAGGYYSNFSKKGIEDWDLWISIIEQGYKAEVIPQVMWEYRIRANQMSSEMYVPKNWNILINELIKRHEIIFNKHHSYIIAKMASNWAEQREWIKEMGINNSWLNKECNEQHKWIQELENQKKSSSKMFKFFIKSLFNTILKK